MPVRVIQMITSPQRHDEVSEEVEGLSPIGVWRQRLDGDTLITSLLIRGEQSQHALDALSKRFGSDLAFRLTMHTIDATLPAPPEDEQDTDAEQPGELGTEDEPSAPGASGTGLSVSREELHSELSEGIRISGRFIGMAVLSSVVASFGMVRDDVAVIIGAMVIAPLLVPNIALALATTLGDGSLARRSLVTNAAGVVISAAPAVVVGLLVPFDPGNASIAARADPSFTMAVIALAAGSAGVLAFTTSVPAGLIGVMVAVALLPPLAASAMLLGAGQWALAGKAAITLLTNVICINLAGVLTFLLQGIRPNRWWEHDRAKVATRVAITVWTVLLAALIALLFFLADTPR